MDPANQKVWTGIMQQTTRAGIAGKELAKDTPDAHAERLLLEVIDALNKVVGAASPLM